MDRIYEVKCINSTLFSMSLSHKGYFAYYHRKHLLDIRVKGDMEIDQETLLGFCQVYSTVSTTPSFISATWPPRLTV